MKKSASAHLLPFEAEEFLAELGRRISIARRSRGWTQQDLAAKAGISIRTMTGLEKGLPTIQIGFWLSALWALDLLEAFASLQPLSQDPATVALLEQELPKRVHSSRKAKVSA